jgi:poly(3-hydroxybutyrate) depolymerase
MTMVHSRFALKTIVILCVLSLCSVRCPGQDQKAVPLAAEERLKLQTELSELERSLATLPESSSPDAAIFAKGLSWALKYDRDFSPNDVALLNRAVVHCRQRTESILAGKSQWKDRRGKLALGFRSKIDDSYQPYGLIVPSGYDPQTPIRLDVVLHGSTRPVGMSELRFMARFDEGDVNNPAPPDHPYLELHPLGRVENCYRWAGETDVFEAIDDVCRRFRVDRDRIVLRGMSMGASGTWHLGLKHPDRFAALGPYCGYVDTHRFSETPLPNFVKVGPLPEHQERGLHLLDSVDYAANASVVPVVACMGEKDVFFDAHVLMSEAMRREGLSLVNLISPGTGHVIDPITHAEQLKRIAGHVAERKVAPADVHFVTWSVKYSECHWLQVLSLNEHYARAELSARLRDDTIEIDAPKNIVRFAVRRQWAPSSYRGPGGPDKSDGILRRIPKPLSVVRIDGQPQVIAEGLREEMTDLIFALHEGQWHFEPSWRQQRFLTKRPGLQGPIDDAFTTPFLCVRGTGQPWNPAVQAYTEGSLKRFADEWHRYFRGDLPVKDDRDVTPEDCRTKNLILFGDPGSNSWIARILPHTPVVWTRDTLRMSGQDYDPRTSVPAMIAPNPLAGTNDRYVVLNTGHSFHDAELGRLNYLLFPRWGDWAVLKIDSDRPSELSVTEQVIHAGYFNEAWTWK